MSPDHPAQRHAHRRYARTRPLAIPLGLVLVYMGLELAGGLVAGSLALLADAGRMLSDAGALELREHQPS